MKSLAPLLLLISPLALACDPPFPLEGTVTIPGCAADADCVPGQTAVNDYFNASADEETLLTIALQSSPWRMYGPDMRIVGPDELAAMLQPTIAEGKVERAVLVASWSGVAPAGGESLAKRLSDALDGFPVDGMDGFLWIDKTGRTRTTRQAFSVHAGGGYYRIERGAEVFVPMVTGWASGNKAQIAANRDADTMLMAAVGDDVFMLCPDGALAAFEQAAALGNAIGAYNAAVMRLERGEREQAIVLLQRAAALGDDRAADELVTLESD